MVHVRGILLLTVKHIDTATYFSYSSYLVRKGKGILGTQDYYVLLLVLSVLYCAVLSRSCSTVGRTKVK